MKLVARKKVKEELRTLIVSTTCRRNMSEYVLTIIGDSWTSLDRLKPSLVNNTVDIYPHTGSNIPVVNLSRGSLTWAKLLKDQDTLKKWALCYPIVTILHVGGVELASGQLIKGSEEATLGRFVTENIEKNIVQLISKAANYQVDSRHIQWNEERIFILVGIPNWHHFRGYAHSLSPEQVKKLRRVINHKLARLTVTLWRIHRVILVKPDLSNPRILGVHLHPDQLNYNSQILEVAKKSVCNNCQLRNYEAKKTLLQLKEVKCPRNPAN